MGRYFCVADHTMRRRFYLNSEMTSEPIEEIESAKSLDGRFVVYEKENFKSWHNSLTFLRDSGAGGDWLRLASLDESEMSPIVFSPEGRRLAYGTRSGVLFVAEMEALKQAVGEFDIKLRAGQ